MKRLLFLLLLATPVFAQGIPYENFLMTAQGPQGSLIPVSFATITVCAGVHTEVPCTPAVTIYSDVGLTQAITPPLTSGPLGNYRFVLAPGTYSVSFTGPGISASNDVIVLGAGGASNTTFSGNNSFTGNNTFSGNNSFSGNNTHSGIEAFTNILTAGKFNNILFVDGTQYANLAAALAALPVSGNAIIFDTLSETFSSNPFAGLPANLNLTIFTSATWTTNVSLVINSGGVLIKGTGRTGSAGAVGVVAGGSFPASTALVQIGTGASLQGTRLEDLILNCNNVTGCIGLTGNGMAENSGLRNVGILGPVAEGIFLTGANTTNFELEDLTINFTGSGTSGIGIYASSIGGNNNRISGHTTVVASPGQQAAAVRVDAAALSIQGLHVENCVKGVWFNTNSNGAISDYVSGGGGTVTDHIRIDTTGGVVVTHASAANYGTNILNNSITSETFTTSSFPTINFYTSSTAAEGSAYFIAGLGGWHFGGTSFANLGTPTNGTVKFCLDCTIANPCAGSGTGALAKRLNSIWVCN